MFQASLQPIKYSRGSLELLDQRLLPMQTVYLPVSCAAEVHALIKGMAVRGAPAIAVAGMLGLAVELHTAGSSLDFDNAVDAAQYIDKLAQYLVTRWDFADNQLIRFQLD